MKLQKRTWIVGSALVALVSVVAIGNTSQSLFSSHQGKKMVRISLTDYKKQMRELQALNLDIAGVNLKRKTVDVLISEEEFALVKRSLTGARFSVSKTFAIDSAPDSEYKTPAEIETILRDYNQRFPELTQLVEVGKSLENRSIWALKITDNPTQRELEEPTLLINAMHHAREVMTPEVPLDMIDYLLTNYSTDAKAKHWVDSNEIWALPMLNVDGNNIVWTRDNMWRKNARGGHGVDLNRNYPYMWGACNGSSGSQFSETYRGPSAGSEPESQVLMNLVGQIKPVFDISFHSYSELVIYPYGCDGQRVLTREIVDTIGHQLGAALPSDDGEGTYTAGTSWETLYAVDGGDIDWMYHEHGVIPFVIEVNSTWQGFQPSYSEWRDRTVEKVRAAWMLLLNRLDGSGIHGVVKNARGLVIPATTISIARASGEPQVQKVNPDGSYHVILNPGTYQIQYQAAGYRSETKSITVGEQKVDLNIELNAN